MDINLLCTQNMPTLTHAVHIRTSSKTAGSHSWEVGATVNSLLGDTFSYDNNMHGADLMFLSRLRSTIYFTNFVSHDPIVLYSWYTEPCYKGSLLYWNFNIQKQCYWSFYLIHIQYQLFKYMHALKNLLLRQEIPAFCFSFYFWYTAENNILVNVGNEIQLDSRTKSNFCETNFGTWGIKPLYRWVSAKKT